MSHTCRSKRRKGPDVEGGREKQRIRLLMSLKNKLRLEANKIIVEARAAIDIQKMAALTEVKNEVGKLVIEVTEKVLRRELSNKEAQEAHIKGLVDEVKLN
jgi:F-type H+-transporting ATPase subunit b